MKTDKSNISPYDLRSIGKLTRNGNGTTKSKPRSNNPYSHNKSK